MQRIGLRALDVATWSWVLWTLYLVGRYGGAVLFDPSTTSRIMAVVSGDRIDSAVGLTYTGGWGACLVLVELGLVGAALPLSHGHRASLRRTSLVIIASWAVLWLGNSVWMQRLSDGRHATRTMVVTVVACVVVARAALRWKGRASGNSIG